MTTRMPAPRWRPELSSSTFWLSSIADEVWRSSANTSAMSPPPARDVARTRSRTAASMRGGASTTPGIVPIASCGPDALPAPSTSSAAPRGLRVQAARAATARHPPKVQLRTRSPTKPVSRRPGRPVSPEFDPFRVPRAMRRPPARNPPLRWPALTWWGSASHTLPAMILPSIETPADLRALSDDQLTELAAEIRTFIVDTVTTTGGHLGSNLGAVELTLALHRVFSSPEDAVLWDTGHQAYVHKLLTGRRYRFRDLRQAGGLSGYPSRAESEHDWIENSHASTALSYAHGLASALELSGALVGAGGTRRVVAVVGDGALTGGMAYEALNNLGHSGRRVVIVLNDNGRSYAPTVSQLSQSLTTLRLNPTYTAARERLRLRLRELPAFGSLAYSGVHSVTSALRDMVAPHTFFEALGVRYAGPIDGHDVEHMEQAFAHAAAWDGPIVVHVLTQKGRGYAPAEEDDIQRLHDVKATKPIALENTVGNSAGRGVGGSASSDGGGIASPGSTPESAVDEYPQRAATYTDAFSRALLVAAEEDPRVVALTAAMPGPTGLLAFQARFPDRFFDVGIAEQHGATSAAGMAMAGLRPVVAVYSTFWSRSFDQANLDVGLHGCPVVFVLDRAGITGDDGPSHHGILDLALALSI